MNWNRAGLSKFLKDIKSENYDRAFVSFNATNLMMQEGIISYGVDLDDNITTLILDFFIKLDAEPLDQSVFRRIIDDLIEVFSWENELEELRILFILYKEDIKQLYTRYSEIKIGTESLKAALRKYCNRKDDFNKLIQLAKRS